MIDNNTILKSSKLIEQWVEKNDYKGYEPFDGLSSFIHPLTLGNLFLERLLMQLVRQSPFNLRPVLGISPMDSTIGRGYMAWGYLLMFKSTQITDYKDKAEDCLNWLIENRTISNKEYCWGKHFDFASRGGRYPKFEPITVWSSLIGMAFLEAYELLKDKKYLDIVESICRWIMKLGRNKTDMGVCLSYTNSNDMTTIHNHNMLASALLMRTGKYTGNINFIKLAQEAMEFSCSNQLENGAWFYGEDERFHWIDNFHTGYNLDSLKSYILSSGDSKYEENLKRGLNFYINHFFEENGRPRYYHNRTYPVDSQCISQSIDTLSKFANTDRSIFELLIKVSTWSIKNMQDKKGYFYYRQYPFIKAKTPMLHWAQATTYKALSSLYTVLD